MLKGLFDDSENSPIGNSVFAQKVLNLYLSDINSMRDKIYGINLDSLKDEDLNKLKEQHKNLPDTTRLQDFRISKAMMHGIRGVMKNNENTFFGLDCSDSDGSPCSMVVLGSNGIGKTSFYAALEMIGMGYSNCAKLRGYVSPTETVKFLTNVNLSSADGRIIVKTGNDSDIDLKLDQYENNPTDPISCESCFCSDFDIQTLEIYSYSSSENTFSKYIHKQLNLDGFDNVLPLLEEFQEKLSEYAKEVREQTADILDLKKNLFFLQIRKYLIYTQQSMVTYDTVDMLSRILDIWKDRPLVLKIKENQNKDKSQDIENIEHKIINCNGEEITSLECRQLLEAYKEELNYLYVFADMNPKLCYEYFDSISDKLLSGNLYIQTKEDLNHQLISYIHHECIRILEKIINGDLEPTILYEKKETFIALQALRKQIKDAFDEILSTYTHKDLNDKRNETEEKITSINAKLNQYGETIKDKFPLNMREADALLEQNKRLKDYLLAQINAYDREILQLLEKIIPNICSKCFSKKGGESIEIRDTSSSSAGINPIDIKYNQNPFEIFIKIKPKASDDSATRQVEEEPGLYLNTFRHKLLCFALKLSLACCAMKLDNCRYPIVVDDVFDASDFKNRNEINLVIKELISQYNSLVEENNSNNLQLILFSQDEIIAERVFKGLTDANNKTRLERLVSPSIYLDTKHSPVKLNLDQNIVEVSFHNVLDPIKSNFS